MELAARKLSPEEALFEYVLRLGDTALILGHRLSEWCSHGPTLEEDIAMTNVALDLIGRARMLLAYAGNSEDRGRSDDDLAYLREAREFRNLLLVEQPNRDFGYTIVRQFLHDAFYTPFYDRLRESADEELAAIAAKAVKESSYHLRHSAQWMARLGDGTEFSHRKMQTALEELWIYTGELFEVDLVDSALIGVGIGVDPAQVKPTWDDTLERVLAEATLQRPEEGWMQTGSRSGQHSEYLGQILAEFQYLQRVYSGAEW